MHRHNCQYSGSGCHMPIHRSTSGYFPCWEQLEDTDENFKLEAKVVGFFFISISMYAEPHMQAGSGDTVGNFKFNISPIPPYPNASSYLGLPLCWKHSGNMETVGQHGWNFLKLKLSGFFSYLLASVSHAKLSPSIIELKNCRWCCNYHNYRLQYLAYTKTISQPMYRPTYRPALYLCPFLGCIKTCKKPIGLTRHQTTCTYNPKNQFVFLPMQNNPHFEPPSPSPPRTPPQHMDPHEVPPTPSQATPRQKIWTTKGRSGIYIWTHPYLDGKLAAPSGTFLLASSFGKLKNYCRYSMWFRWIWSTTGSPSTSHWRSKQGRLLPLS